MRIGYYAHHHGSGHCRQVDKLAALLPPQLRATMSVFTSVTADDYHFSALTEAQIIRLSLEDEREDEVLNGRAGQYWQPDSLHYSPIGNRDIQKRSWQLLNAIYERQIDLMIIDVSVEVAMLCRAASVPYLYVRLAGVRDDSAHLGAFAGALALLTPFPRALEAASTPDWVVQKSLYLGFIANQKTPSTEYQAFISSLIPLAADKKAQNALQSMTLSNQNAPNLAHPSKTKPLLITVIKGYGGHEAIDAKLPELRRALPDAFIISLGPINQDKRNFVDIATEVNDVAPFIDHSDLLIMACGLNSIAQVYDQDTPLVVLPDVRPHQEQEAMAEALIRQGRALGWSQFIQLADMDGDNKNNAIYQRLTALLSFVTPDNTDNTVQDFMSSLTDYASVKLWFYEWLLPKLDIAPERTA